MKTLVLQRAGSRLVRPLLAGATGVVLLAGCDLSTGAHMGQRSIPGGPTDGVVVARINCTGTPQSAQLTCVNVDSAGNVLASIAASADRAPSTDIVLGGQNLFVKLTAGNVGYAGGIFSFDVDLQNLIGQSLGTADGAKADTGGVRVFFNTGPNATAGSGTIDFKDPNTGASLVDGFATFTATNQPYYKFPGMLDTGRVSTPRTWKIHVPSTVTTFQFSVYVDGAVPHPNGWVSVAPSAPALNPSQTVALSATVRDRIGRPLTGQTVTWNSSNSGVASVSASGVVTAVAAGTATITATSGQVTGSVPVDVVGTSDVAFAVNTANRFPISRFVYGVNAATESNAWGNTTPPVYTLNRFGGNRLTAFNWETGWSNAGNDYNYENDNYLSSSSAVGAAVTQRAQPTFNAGAGMLLTVPTIGYVAGDASGITLDTADSTLATRLATHFKVSRASKGSAFTLTPNQNDGYVYQDEFVNWVDKTYPGARFDAQRPIFFSLDNEPDIWTSTHREIRPDSGDNANRPRIWTYDGFADTTILYANAIKKVIPTAVVFGPAVSTYTGMVAGSRYTNNRWYDDPVYGEQNFLGVYLDRMSKAEQTYGRRLLDVLDVHWYPATGTSAYSIDNDWVAASDSAADSQIRMQAPRSLWDPSYTEPNSWVTSVTNGPIQLLRRLNGLIASHYPGTKLAITEYYYGRGGDLSGGIAQADLLGVFGREHLFAATLWPNADIWAPPYGGSGAAAYAYIFGAFKMFLSYDGAGGHFGDTGAWASTSDSVNTSVYASLDSAGHVVIVAINKQSSARRAVISISHPTTLTTGKYYTLTIASPNPSTASSCTTTSGATCVIGANNVVTYTMPKYSVTTLVLSP